MRPKAAFTSATSVLTAANPSRTSPTKAWGLPARGLDAVGDVLRLGQVRVPRHGDARALGGESQRDRLADARGTAGDERSLSLQSHDPLLPDLPRRGLNERRVRRARRGYQPPARKSFDRGRGVR